MNQWNHQCPLHQQNHDPDSEHAHDCSHDHDHGSGHSHGLGGGHRPKEKSRLILTLIITLVMMVIEVFGGVISGSLALISDAGHMFTHLFALGVSLVAILIASRPASKQRTFGYYRVEVLAALINGVTLIGVSIFIFYEAIERVLDPQPIFGMQMLVIAIAGLIVNLISAVILHGASKEDLNVRSAFFHMVGDTLSSVAVIGGAVVIWMTGWTIIDPILSVLICVVILVWSWKLITEAVNILLESAPAGLEMDKITRTMREVCGGQCELRDLHLWTITSGMPVLTAQIALAEERIDRRDSICKELQQTLLEKYGIRHSTLQFERLE